MTTKLLRTISAEYEIIKSQNAIIDELFVIICDKLSPSELSNIEPLLTDIQAVAERERRYEHI